VGLLNDSLHGLQSRRGTTAFVNELASYFSYGVHILQVRHESKSYSFRGTEDVPHEAQTILGRFAIFRTTTALHYRADD
jgi:hypothetical protein